MPPQLKTISHVFGPNSLLLHMSNSNGVHDLCMIGSDQLLKPLLAASIAHFGIITQLVCTEDNQTFAILNGSVHVACLFLPAFLVSRPG